MKKQKHERVTRINSKVARNINRSILLNTVRTSQPISRARLAEITQLNKSTVSSIVDGLLRDDLLEESPDRGGKIGRNPVNLGIKHGRHFVGAISLDAPCTRLAIVDIDGTIKARDEIWTKAVPAIDLLSQYINRLNVLRSSLGPHQFHGIGVSVAGIVDAAQSRVVYASNLGWVDVDLELVIRELLPDIGTISVENDAKASALAELILGTHQLSSTNLIFLLLGAGIGAGIVMHGRILGGTTNAAGEVGHMTVVDGGEPCQCGNAGCWELYASERAPIRWYSEVNKMSPEQRKDITIADVISDAQRGDENALNALHLWGQHIGVGIGDMIRILDPEVVVVGGTITQVWDIVAGDITSAARGKGAFAKQRGAAILPTSIPDNPSLLGAAALSVRKIFGDVRISW
jgi:predicted NBD/HSP70 family sugar kinase